MNKLAFLTIVALAVFSACGRKMEETRPIRKDVMETVFASGMLAANDSYSLTAQSDGYLAEVLFDVNDVVQQGQVLAVIDNRENRLNTESAEALYRIARRNASPGSPVLQQAGNAVKVAREKMLFDSLQAVRYKNLLEANSIARSEYESKTLQYQTSKADYLSALENLAQQQQQANQELVVNRTQKEVNAVMVGFNQVKALSAGKVYNKVKQKGDFVRKGDVIAVIGDPGSLYAHVNIDESSIQKVQVGQEVVVQLNTHKNKNYKGKVAEILPTFNEGTQSFDCKIQFTDSLDFGILNTQLQANIITGINKNALLIPRNYLDYGNLVKVKDRKEPVKVQTRFVSSEWVQVESGIDENTVLVTENIKPQ